jgi:DNA-binding XRE family transcriptional regulator
VAESVEVRQRRQVLAVRAPQHVLALLVYDELASLVVLEQLWERGFAFRCADTFLARPSSPAPRLAHAIRQLRERSGLSQETVAHNAGLTVSAYARIGRGEANPTWTTVTHIADALGVTLAELGTAVESKR